MLCYVMFLTHGWYDVKFLELFAYSM